jgi:hypothetical protein
MQKHRQARRERVEVPMDGAQASGCTIIFVSRCGARQGGRVTNWISLVSSVSWLMDVGPRKITFLLLARVSRRKVCF